MRQDRVRSLALSISLARGIVTVRPKPRSGFAAQLAALPEADRAVALNNLRLIRRTIAHPRFAPS